MNSWIWPIAAVLLLSLPACAPASARPVALPNAVKSVDAAAPETPPGTDIFLVPISAKDGAVRLGSAPENITNRTGYDNQPGWMPAGDALLFTSIGADEQADIFRYDLANGSTTRMTATPESEYSPTVMPDGRGISVVRVEADSTQRLWRFGLDGSAPRLLLEHIAPVGYHAWADSSTLALFVLGDPPTLQIADLHTEAAEIVSRNIGRSLNRVPGRNAISFVDKATEGGWWIRELDLATRAIRPLVRTLPGAEDFAWTPNGTLLMAQESTLYQWAPGMAEWTPVADFASAGLRNITRLAVSLRGDQLALVANEQPQP